MEWMEIKSGAKQNCRIRVAVGVRARAPRGKILGERQGGDSVGRRRGLFWWRGSINIALLPPRLLVCLAAHLFTLYYSAQCSG